MFYILFFFYFTLKFLKNHSKVCFAGILNLI